LTAAPHTTAATAMRRSLRPRSNQPHRSQQCSLHPRSRRHCPRSPRLPSPPCCHHRPRASARCPHRRRLRHTTPHRHRSLRRRLRSTSSPIPSAPHSSSSACARTQRLAAFAKGSLSQWRGISSYIQSPTRYVRSFSRLPAHPAVARGRPRLRLPSLHPIATWQPSTPPSKISTPPTRPRTRLPTCDVPLRRASQSSPSSPCLHAHTTTAATSECHAAFAAATAATGLQSVYRPVRSCLIVTALCSTPAPDCRHYRHVQQRPLSLPLPTTSPRTPSCFGTPRQRHLRY
jgi:hypothetical protein